MAEFINTIDLLGDDAVIDSIIDRTITEFKDDKLTKLGEASFRFCKHLSSIDLPNVTGLNQQAFDGCSSLTHVNLPNVKWMDSGTFSNCSALECIELPEFVGRTVGSAYPAGWFSYCSSLKRAVFPKLTWSGMSATFSNCRKLEYIDIPTTFIGNGLFENCKSLVALVLRNQTLATNNTVNVFKGCDHYLGTVSTEYNPGGLKDGYIYVPRSLVDSYKAATNWSAYATQFRALEDYTVDGTIDGALDESKI